MTTYGETTITANETFNANNSTYNTFYTTNGSKVVNITLVSGDINYVNVNYRNASAKAFRGMGKDFQNFDAALAKYKCKKIRACILAVKQELN